MIATPTALNLANAPPPIGVISAPIPALESPALVHSTRKPASRSKPTSKAGRLEIVKTKERGKETWTVKTGKRGEKKSEFRIRLTDSGYRVMIRFHDDAGRRPERYCCYLSTAEWRDAKRQSLADFARLIAGKVDARYSAGDMDNVRYQEITPRLAALTEKGNYE